MLPRMMLHLAGGRVEWAVLGLLALALCACSSNGDWRPETRPWVKYNLQFVEGKKFIATWVRAYGRGRTNRESFLFGDFHEFQIHGLDYAFYEGDYGEGGELRTIGSLSTLSKLEILATPDSLILAEFTASGLANLFWLDRRTGAIGKEIKGISMGPYRLGEFQLRFYQAGREDDAPTFREEQALLTSVRPWGDNRYLLELGSIPAISRGAGFWTDFTKPNEFAPQPFLMLDTRSKSFTPFHPDTVFGVGPRYWVEVWKSGALPVGLHAMDAGRALVLVKGGRETDTLILGAKGLDSVGLATYTRSESRGRLEVSVNWGPWADYAMEADAFGAGVERKSGFAPDGETEYVFRYELPFEFVNTVSGQRTSYAEPAD